jgi:hypothetical protein
VRAVLALALVGTFGVPSFAAEYGLDTWTSGSGATTYVFKSLGDTFVGAACGPCDKPEGVFLIDDGALDGDAISFFIHHVENRRNFMKGVITGNVMKFKWVREGHESEPGGEMTLIGPIR